MRITTSPLMRNYSPWSAWIAWRIIGGGGSRQGAAKGPFIFDLPAERLAARDQVSPQDAHVEHTKASPQCVPQCVRPWREVGAGDKKDAHISFPRQAIPYLAIVLSLVQCLERQASGLIRRVSEKASRVWSSELQDKAWPQAHIVFLTCCRAADSLEADASYAEANRNSNVEETAYDSNDDNLEVDPVNNGLHTDNDAGEVFTAAMVAQVMNMRTMTSPNTKKRTIHRGSRPESAPLGFLISLRRGMTSSPLILRWTPCYLSTTAPQKPLSAIRGCSPH
ncbi:hypothetical protein K470DRAFT_265634 [Piedraia hortae CBS 480.64]|uniref:Uncharacterized protein n=1 Tax=Piedraia hortae CBS 480.64 TaxID=1314780 RepID=A0A6A7BWA7_9PEZI|nr:hypothetical protein K470DRAFT_265634 [Piedraia hortae CBS 480.64]